MIDITGSSQGNVFGEALERLANSRAAITAGVEAAKAGIQHNFDTERSGKGPWRDLADSTITERAKVGLGPHPILYRGGRYGPRTKRPARILRETFNQDSPLDVSDDHAVIGSRDPRLSELVDDRPILALQKEDQRAVFDAMIEVLTRG